MRFWRITPERARAMYPGGRANAEARWYVDFWTRVIRLGLLPRRWVVLEVAGRRSGLLRAVPLGMADHEGAWYLVSMLGERPHWVGNVRASGGLVRLRRRRSVACRLVEVPVERRAPVIKRHVAIAPGARPHVPVDRHAPVEAFAAVAADHPVFRVEVLGGGRLP